MSEEKTQPKRRYVIVYRRGGGTWGQLEPNVHESLYARPQVAFAVAFMQANPFVEGTCVRLGDDLFNIMVTLDSGENPKAFEFKERAAKALVLPKGRT